MMRHRIPLIVKFVIGFLVVRLLLSGVVIFLFQYFIGLGIEASLNQLELKQRILEGFSIPAGDPQYQGGYLIGKLAIPCLLAVLLMIVLIRRHYLAAVIIASLDILFAFPGLPFFQIGVLVIILTNPTRRYLKRKTEQNLGGEEVLG